MFSITHNVTWTIYYNNLFVLFKNPHSNDSIKHILIYFVTQKGSVVDLSLAIIQMKRNWLIYTDTMRCYLKKSNDVFLKG